MKNILFVASEGVPFIKTGGLADVVGSLPKDIDRRYFDVRVILPKYTCMAQEMKDKLEYVSNFYMDFHWKSEYVGIFHAEVDGVHYYFIDNEYYFSRDGLYGFYDDCERFVFFDRAVLEMLKYIDFTPDIINCNDWQTALIPVYYNVYYKYQQGYDGIKSDIFSLGIFILVNSLLNSSNKKLIKSFESFALIPSNKGFFALITLLNSSGA